MKRDKVIKAVYETALMIANKEKFDLCMVAGRKSCCEMPTDRLPAFFKKQSLENVQTIYFRHSGQFGTDMVLNTEYVNPDPYDPYSFIGNSRHNIRLAYRKSNGEGTYDTAASLIFSDSIRSNGIVERTGDYVLVSTSGTEGDGIKLLQEVKALLISKHCLDAAPVMI